MNEQIILGSKAFPLKLTPHGGSKSSGKFTMERKNICSKFVNLPHEEGHSLDFYKIKQEEPLAFVANLIANPNLGATELKLAILLYEKLNSCPEGIVVLTGVGLTNGNIGKFIGEEDLFYFGFESDSNPFYVLDESFHMKDLFDELNMAYEVELAIKCIKILHDFSYLTITSICWDNIHERSARNIKKESLDMRVWGYVVQLYPMMDERNVRQYWKHQTDVSEK